MLLLWFGYSFLGGLMCTSLINPVFYIRLVKTILYRIKKEKAYDTEGEWEYDTLGGGITAEVTCFLCGFLFIGIIYFGVCLQDITFWSMISVIWIPVLLKGIISMLKYQECNNTVSEIVIFVLIFVISIGVNTISSIYEAVNPQKLTVNLIEPDVPKMAVDVTTMLDKFNISDSDLRDPVYRNGEIIYVLENDTTYISSPGYISVKDDEVKYVKYDLNYKTSDPDVGGAFGTNYVEYQARKILPDKVFFGNFSFQKDDEGNVYYACLYGTHKFLRAGRNIEGFVYVNASTGEVKTCALEEIPTFIVGIAK